MLDRANLIYRYDGTLNGMLCCVYEAMTKREQPMMIVPFDEMQSLLYPEKRIETDVTAARRVADAIRGRISEEALALAGHALLTTLPGRESYLLDVIRRAFKAGPGLLDNLADPAVCKLNKAVLQLRHEAHLYTGFIRFQQNAGVLTSVIEPKNQVLPLLIPHFSDRFAGETFLIYDKTHRAALLHSAQSAERRGTARIFPLEALKRPPADEEEQAMQALWRGFYKTIAVEGRKNPTCQRTHMPGRYWAQMTEHQPGAVHLPGAGHQPDAVNLHLPDAAALDMPPIRA